jgi:hypothetical protein
MLCNNFIKFNIHIRLQGCGLPAQQELTPSKHGRLTNDIGRVSCLRATRSKLQRIIRDVLHNNFIKFNVHSRLQGYGLPAQQELTPVKGILRMPFLFKSASRLVSTVVCSISQIGIPKGCTKNSSLSYQIQKRSVKLMNATFQMSDAKKKVSGHISSETFYSIGADERNRTVDLLITN